MPRRIVFYISGHGYGHARRTAQALRALRTLSPETELFVRTTAPARIFDEIVPASNVSQSEVDAGAAERSPLVVDPAGTLDRIAAVLARRNEIIARELAYLRDIRPELMVADIPFLAGDVSAAAGVPCLGMSNFCWAWIIEPFIEQFPHRRSLLDAVRAGYGKMAGILRMPLGGICDSFASVTDVPLVANRSRREETDVLRELGLSQDPRPRVLFGVRGSIPTATLEAAARQSPDLCFLCPTNEPGDVPAGVVAAPVGTTLDFSDVLSVCDVVVGKMGYGLIAECIVSGVSLLWPRRSGFREDAIVERDGPEVLRMCEFPLPAFKSGDWAASLQNAIALPRPPVQMRTDGAEECARIILG